MKQQDELLEELAQLAKDGFAKAQEEWEKSVAAWRESLCPLDEQLLDFSTQNGDTKRPRLQTLRSGPCRRRA